MLVSVYNNEPMTSLNSYKMKNNVFVYLEWSFTFILHLQKYDLQKAYQVKNEMENRDTIYKYGNQEQV